MGAQDFANLVGDTTTPIPVSAGGAVPDADYLKSATAKPTFELTGFPPPPLDYPIAGLEGTTAALSPSPWIASIQGTWDSAVSVSESLVEKTYGGVKSVAKTVYGDVASGVGTVYDDIAKPVNSLLTGTYMYLLLGIVVIGGVIYFAGKSGALRVSRIV